MLITDSGYRGNKAFTDRKQPVSFGVSPLNTGFIVKKAQFPAIQLSSFAGNLISGAAYLVAGPAMIYEFLANRKNALPEKTKSRAQQAQKPNIFENFAKNRLNEKYVQFQGNLAPAAKAGETKPAKSEGIETLNPKTEIGKLGIDAARVGVFTAGVAGVANGVAMRLPLLAIGEGVTTFAAPIIETPVGLAIFGVGLGTINLARVLHGDNKYQIDPIKFKNSNLSEKFSYIMKNMGTTLAELGKSLKVIGTNFVDLFGKKNKEAARFFKTHMLSTNPTNLVLEEFMDKDRNIIIKKSMKTSSYLMHFATAALSLGSLTIIVANKLKMNKVEKHGLKAHNAGLAIDNIALSKWGVEKFKTSPVATYKTSGIFSTVAGASILAGQPGIDKDWGRGLNWTGVGLILSGFALERLTDFRKLWKNRKVRQAVTTPIRQWKVELDKIFTRKELKEKIMVNGSEKSRHKAIIEAINKGEEVAEPKLADTVGRIEGVLGKNRPNNTPVFREDINDVKKELNAALPDSKKYLSLDSITGKASEVIDFLTKESKRLFGETPVPYTGS